jgi:hypothetical protein
LIPSRSFGGSASLGRLFLRLVDPALRRRDRFRGFRERALDFRETIDPDEAISRRAAEAARDEAIPSPKLAAPGNKPLADRQVDAAVILDHHADLSEAPCKSWRSGNMSRERACPCWERRVGHADGRAGPFARAVARDGGIEIVAQRGSKRALETRVRLQV